GPELPAHGRAPAAARGLRRVLVPAACPGHPEGPEDLRDVRGRQRRRLAHVDRPRPTPARPGDPVPPQGPRPRASRPGRASGRGRVILSQIGCGEPARSSHGPAQALYVLRHPETVLAACCDVDGEKAERYRHRSGFARSYTDALAMVEAERPEAAALVVP